MQEEKKRTEVTRRTFLGATGLGLGTGLARATAFESKSPNDTIVLGMIGVGGKGVGRLREFMEHEDVRIGAVCDVDSSHLQRAVLEVKEKRGYQPEAFADFRYLLDQQDIDAVVVVTPDHWHAIPTVWACQAGKDVFVEKPLSFSVVEGRAMVNAAAANQRVTQMGNQIHNDLPNYRRVVELVRSGFLGRVTRVNCWKTSAIQGRGTPPNCASPPELDYDFWLGPAPKRPYNPLRSHGTYRHFWDYSGGTFIDFWCHIVDVVYWAMDLSAPRSVSAIGGRFFLADGTETPDTLEVVLEFPELVFVYTFHPNPLPGFEHMGSIGCIFEGTEATLVTNYQEHEVFIAGKKVEDLPRPEPSLADSPGHLREFLDGVKSRNTETTCNVAYGHKLTKPGLLANIAYRTGEKIYWDDKQERILGQSDANRLLHRVYRKPWTL